MIDRMPEEVKKKLLRKTYNENETILYAENENNFVYFLIEGKAEAYVQICKVPLQIYIFMNPEVFLVSWNNSMLVGSPLRFLL